MKAFQPALVAALLGLAGCVTNDGYGGRGYAGGYGASSNPYYASSGPYYAYDRSPTVHCNLPGQDVNTTPWECRNLQRRHGVSEDDARRRAGLIHCHLPGEDDYTTPEDCRRRQRAAGGRSEADVSRRTIHCNLPGQDVNTTPEDCRRRQQAAGNRSQRDSNQGYRSGGREMTIRPSTPVSE